MIVVLEILIFYFNFKDQFAVNADHFHATDHWLLDHEQIACDLLQGYFTPVICLINVLQ